MGAHGVSYKISCSDAYNDDAKEDCTEVLGVIEKLLSQRYSLMDSYLPPDQDLLQLREKIVCFSTTLSRDPDDRTMRLATLGLYWACSKDLNSAQSAMESGAIPWLIQLLYQHRKTAVNLPAVALYAILIALDNDSCRLVALQSGIVPAVDSLLTGDSIGQAWINAACLALVLSRGHEGAKQLMASPGIVSGLCRIVKAGCERGTLLDAVHESAVYAALAALSELQARESELSNMAIVDNEVLSSIVRLAGEQRPAGTVADVVSHDSSDDAVETGRASAGDNIVSDPCRVQLMAASVLHNVSSGSHSLRLAAIEAGALEWSDGVVEEGIFREEGASNDANHRVMLWNIALKTSRDLLEAQLADEAEGKGSGVADVVDDVVDEAVDSPVSAGPWADLQSSASAGQRPPDIVAHEGRRRVQRDLFRMEVQRIFVFSDVIHGIRVTRFSPMEQARNGVMEAFMRMEEQEAEDRQGQEAEHREEAIARLERRARAQRASARMRRDEARRSQRGAQRARGRDRGRGRCMR